MTIEITLTETKLKALKRGFSLHFPTMKSSHRTELAARGLGFRTYASLLARLREDDEVTARVTPEPAAAFGEQIGFEVLETDLYDAVSEFSRSSPGAA
ncbi:MAG: hypothetical protein KDK11_05805 [Maritimibacter sp.]|nr:hypothetical protein [Maritimibacter sp.]